jgi:hypothetical protein
MERYPKSIQLDLEGTIRSGIQEEKSERGLNELRVQNGLRRSGGQGGRSGRSGGREV